MPNKTGGAAHFADDLQQLDNVIEIIEVARVMRAGNAVSGVLKASAELLVAGDYRSEKQRLCRCAERGLQNARREFSRLGGSLSDLLSARQAGIWGHNGMRSIAASIRPQARAASCRAK
jgi:hypothetical protein